MIGARFNDDIKFEIHRSGWRLVVINSSVFVISTKGACPGRVCITEGSFSETVASVVVVTTIKQSLSFGTIICFRPAT